MLKTEPTSPLLTLPARTLRGAWWLVLETVSRWSRNDGNTLAASVAYYAAFSFFPLVMVLISALGFALEFSKSAQDAQKQLLSVLAERTVPEFEREVRSVLNEVQTRAIPNSFLAALTLLFGAIGMFSQLESAFERLWHEAIPHQHGILASIRNALWNRLKAFLTLLALGLLLLVSLVADIVLAGVRNWTEDFGGGILAWRMAQWSFAIAFNALVLMLIYKSMPRVPVAWRHAACGGLVTAIVWQVSSQLLARFIVGGNYSAYGVVGSFIAVMLWVYCASVLLFLGGQLVQVLGHPEENGGKPPQSTAGGA